MKVSSPQRAVSSRCAVVLLALFGWVGTAVADPLSGPYDFPVRPGSEAWNAAKSHQEMVEITQIPGEVLGSMSTRDLVRTVLDYPLLAEILAFDSPQRGFDVVASRFNGLQELLSRPDVGTELLTQYRSRDAAGIPTKWVLERQGRHSFEIFYLELLLAQEPVLERFDDPQLREVLVASWIKTRQKAERYDVFGPIGLERTAVLIARILRVMEPARVTKAEPADLDAFVRNAGFASPEILEFLWDRAEELVGDDLDPTSGYSLPSERPRLDLTKDYSSTVTTPAGSSVSVIVRTWEMSASDIAYLNAQADSYHASATRETDASRRYNCHSYAWYSTSTSNIRWMNTPGDDTYWQDGSYYRVYSMSNGRRISYASDDHSAIAISSTQARSKWGSWPRMKHSPTLTPYNSSSLRYYEAACLGSGCPGPSVSLSCSGNYSGSSQVSCTANVSSGTPPYTYSWTYSGTAQSWSSGGAHAYAYYNSPKCTSSSFNYFYVSVTDLNGNSAWASKSPISCY